MESAEILNNIANIQSALTMNINNLVNLEESKEKLNTHIESYQRNIESLKQTLEQMRKAYFSKKKEEITHDIYHNFSNFLELECETDKQMIVVRDENIVITVELDETKEISTNRYNVDIKHIDVTGEALKHVNILITNEEWINIAFIIINMVSSNVKKLAE